MISVLHTFNQFQICIGIGWKVDSVSVLKICTLGAVDSVFDSISVALGCIFEIDLSSQFNPFGEDRKDLSDWSVLSLNPEFRAVCRWGGFTAGNILCGGADRVSPVLLSVLLAGAVVPMS